VGTALGKYSQVEVLLRCCQRVANVLLMAPSYGALSNTLSVLPFSTNVYY
jgi:hypothetical protein